MTIQPVRLFGDPILRARAAEVESFDKEVRQLVTDLTDTMYESGGVGMAAPQIGVGLRVFVYDTGDAQGHLINPEFEVIGEDTQTGPEGCLSIPGVREDVTRAMTVRARGVDVDGNPVEFQAEGLLARCVQHETDHLDGVLFLQRLEPATRKEAMRTLRESSWFTRGITVLAASELGGRRRATAGKQEGSR
ncbi:peptide deformylase [Nocardia huaxiensis]|uniref:Peptide deformylase n=1 Tax=Nocardia huaxiensis TaxID=2755382 RepID=A0A7D6ZJ77_9NOCA|nr:peptide deformylase [Nocardia huaxiensis]QLY29043.1 peptide deformylase [Nocardia huaxiensis]UFS97472.1 peptide deformylase [Nocardia huaxiensis]